jgi:sterol desaturase/sphingolipid hydroxylase (fatty acid hydroxylase superfamily)
MVTLQWLRMMEPKDDPVIYAIPFFLLLISIELFINWREQRHLYHAKEALASIGMGLGSLVINVLMKALAFGVMTMLFEFRLFEIGWHWWSWVLMLFADDFSFYWHHRLSHEIRVLWAAHVNHHSSQDYNLAIALRQSWVEQLYKYVFWLWLPIVGFDPLMVMIMMSFSLIYQYWVHTEIIRKFPAFIEFIFNTPSHHRVHHASNVRYLDQNHGGILIIWDRLFGTFTAESDEERPVYGITSNIHTHNLFKIAFHEYQNVWNDVKNAPKWSDKLKYLFYSPGWSHNGPDQRARTLRKALANKS